MLLFVDENNKLQHKPFHKARSHQERIPWISHHPEDVKRGTFIGEMSRLDTLCSLQLDYKEALEGLAALYVTRGYQMDKGLINTNKNVGLNISLKRLKKLTKFLY